MMRRCEREARDTSARKPQRPPRATPPPLPVKGAPGPAQERRNQRSATTCQPQDHEGPSPLPRPPAIPGRGAKRPADVRPVADGPLAGKPPRLPKTAAAQIPSLEPPAPMAVRCNNWHMRRVWLRNRTREIPCWLLSMLSHLALFILLASLVVPLGQTNCLAPLIFQFCEPEADGVDDENAADQLVTLVEGSDAQTDRKSPALDPQPDPGQAAPSLDKARQAEQMKRVIAQSLFNLQTTLITARDAPPVDLRPLEVKDETVDPPVEEKIPDRERLDEIVDQFIEYDIGNLSGAAGHRANFEFQRLGPEAIPSLVRGLNKAAGYSQSCPVCVISRSLESAMNKTSDPVMISFALDNIGRGVPKDAPHAARVFALRQRWLTRVIKQNNIIRADLRARDLPADRPMVQLVRKLTLGSDDEVLEALCDTDVRNRLAAVVAVQHRGRRGNGTDVAAGRVLADVVEDSPPEVQRHVRAVLTNLAGGADLGNDREAWNEHFDVVERTRLLEHATPEQLSDALHDDEWRIRRDAAVVVRGSAQKFGDGHRLQLAQRLIELLEDYEPKMRDAAHNGLVALADRDYDPPEDSFGEPSAERRAERWRNYWQDFDRDNVVGPRADSFLAMGTTLEEIGRPREAAERYRRILDEYPSTAAADTARKRLKSMGRN